MHVSKNRVRRLRDVHPPSRHAHIKGDESFPQYTRIIAVAKAYVRRKQMRDSEVAEDFTERIISRALDELKPEHFNDALDERVKKIARRVFDDELQHHRWTERATQSIPSSLPESSVHGTTERVLGDPLNPLTRRPSRSEVRIASPVKLAEPDEDGNDWTSIDDLAFADAHGYRGGCLRGQNRNIVEHRMVAKLDRDDMIRSLMRIISLDDLRFIIGYLNGDTPRTGANRTRWSRLKKTLACNKSRVLTATYSEGTSNGG